MSKKLFLVVLLTLTGCISWVFAKSPFSELPAGEYKLDLTHASIVWKVSHFGLSDYTARFTRFDASIDFDPSDIAASKVNVTIDPTSIQTAYPNPEQEDFDKTLAQDSGWFNAGEYPAITFSSTSITMLNDKQATMTGDLTFLGQTKSVSMDVTLNGAMLKQPFSGLPTMGFSATTTVKRSLWGMDKFVPNIGDDVEVMIEGEFALSK